jgi:hypothetical protein
MKAAFLHVSSVISELYAKFWSRKIFFGVITLDLQAPRPENVPKIDPQNQAFRMLNPPKKFL